MITSVEPSIWHCVECKWKHLMHLLFFKLSFEFLFDYLKTFLSQAGFELTPPFGDQNAHYSTWEGCNTLSLVPNMLMSPISKAFSMEWQWHLMPLRSLSFQFLCSHSKLPVVEFNPSSPFRNQEPHVLKAWKSLSLASSTTWSSWHLMQVIWWSVLSACPVVLCCMQIIHLLIHLIHDTLKAYCQEPTASSKDQKPHVLKRLEILEAGTLAILKTDSGYLMSRLIGGACFLVWCWTQMTHLHSHSFEFWLFI